MTAQSTPTTVQPKGPVITSAADAERHGDGHESERPAGQPAAELDLNRG